MLSPVSIPSACICLAMCVQLAGHVVFHGPREDVLPFFSNLGFQLPERKGIADFLQEVISKKDQQVCCSHSLQLIRTAFVHTQAINTACALTFDTALCCLCAQLFHAGPVAHRMALCSGMLLISGLGSSIGALGGCHKV